MSLRLCPAQKALPAAASTTTRTDSSRPASSSACCSAESISAPSALNRAGSFRVKVTTPRASRVVVSTSSKFFVVIVCSSEPSARRLKLALPRRGPPRKGRPAALAASPFRIAQRRKRRGKRRSRSGGWSQIREDPQMCLHTEPQLAHVVLAVTVKTRTHKNHLGLEGLQPGHPHHLDDLADVHAPRVGGHG